MKRQARSVRPSAILVQNSRICGAWAIQRSFARACHISELADFRVRRTEDVVKMGDSITVKCIGIDEKSGKVRLSRKAAMAELEAQNGAAPAATEPAAPSA